MLVKIFGGAINGIEATTITIEVNILWGQNSSLSAFLIML